MIQKVLQDLVLISVILTLVTYCLHCTAVIMTSRHSLNTFFLHLQFSLSELSCLRYLHFRALFKCCLSNRLSLTALSKSALHYFLILFSCFIFSSQHLQLDSLYLFICFSSGPQAPQGRDFVFFIHCCIINAWHVMGTQ